MATDYTPNYNLDKYVAADKPNLRDQYNAAMDKIDLALLSANTNATEAKAATQSFADDISAKADQTNLDALSALLPAAQFSAQNTVKAALDAKANSSALSSLATKAELQSEATARANADTALTAKLAEKSTTLFGKKILCIGDSLTHHTPIAQSWPEYLAQIHGCTTYNFAAGGTGFVYGSPNFLTQLNNAHSSSAFNDSDITDIIIIGGFNDYASDAATVSTAVTNCISYARSTFQNANIHVGAMLHGVSPLDTPNGGATAAQYRSRLIAPIHDACMSNGCTWIDGCWYWCVGINGFDYGDDIHLNVQGQKYVSGYIASHLSGGSTDRIESQKLTISENAQSYITSLDGFAFAKNGIVNVTGKFTYAGNDSTTVFQSDITRLYGTFRSSHANAANTSTVETYKPIPAQGSRIYTVAPRIYSWQDPNNNRQVVSIHQLNDTSFNKILFFNLTYPFGL